MSSQESLESCGEGRLIFNGRGESCPHVIIGRNGRRLGISPKPRSRCLKKENMLCSVRQ